MLKRGPEAEPSKTDRDVGLSGIEMLKLPLLDGPAKPDDNIVEVVNEGVKGGIGWPASPLCPAGSVVLSTGVGVDV